MERSFVFGHFETRPLPSRPQAILVSPRLTLDSLELAYAGIAHQTELLRAREISARELVSTYLERIERLDKSLNAFRVVTAERALEEADAAQARLDAGEKAPLLGISIAVKDNVDVAGELTTHGTGRSHAPRSG